MDITKRAFDFFQSCLRLTQRSLLDAIKRSSDLLGRTSRKPFWIAFLIFGFCAVYLRACEIWMQNWELGELETFTRFAFKGVRYVFMYILFTLLVRRFHDVGVSIGALINPFSGKWPLVGPLAALFDPSDPGDNQYGPPHKL